jgi:hypothetical protein
MELLAMLVVTRFRVRVAIDDLDRSLGALELHFLLHLALAGNVLLAFLLVGRHAIVAWLLLLLLMALLGIVAPGVVHWAPQPALITASGLARSLVTAWATAPPVTAATATALREPASGLLLLLLDFFFFFLFLFLPLL